jgi:hypothetical protein
VDGFVTLPELAAILRVPHRGPSSPGDRPPLPPYSEFVEEDLKRAWLAHYGARCTAIVLLSGPAAPDLERLLGDALVLSRRDPSVTQHQLGTVGSMRRSERAMIGSMLRNTPTGSLVAASLACLLFAVCHSDPSQIPWVSTESWELQVAVQRPHTRDVTEFRNPCG